MPKGRGFTSLFGKFYDVSVLLTIVYKMTIIL